MAEIKDPRGKHLLGEAVRLLVQSGATGASITDFINEYSGVIEASLAPLPEPAQPDLKGQLKEALKEVLMELAPQERKPAPGLRKPVTVHLAGMKRTTVFVRKDLLSTATTAVGGEKQVRQLINELANTKPEDLGNRSAWVEEQLKNHLLLLKAETNLSNQTTH